IRQEGLALVAVEAGRDEHIELAGDNRERQERRAEHCQLQLGDEIFEQRRVDELGVLRPRHQDEGPDQDVVDILGEDEAEREHHAEGEQRLDEPRAQLDQVLHQRGLGGLDVLVRHAASPARFGASAGGVSAGAGSASGGAGAKSALVTGGSGSGSGTSIAGNAGADSSDAGGSAGTMSTAAAAATDSAVASGTVSTGAALS